MQFKLRKASDYPSAVEVEIENLQDLQALQEKYDHQLIIDFEEKEIVIYDYYVE